MPQQQRDRETESQRHQAQEAQAPLEPGRDALDLGEAAQDRAGFLLKDRPARAALPVAVGDAIPGLWPQRAIGAVVERYVSLARSDQALFAVPGRGRHLDDGDDMMDTRLQPARAKYSDTSNLS